MKTIKTWVLMGAALLVLWFFPWTFVFSSGIVVYFPYKADGESRYVRVTGPLLATFGIDRSWASPEDIPLHCMASVIAAEDSRFLDHHGIDLESIGKTLKRNRKRGTVRGGASTLTQQLVKNVFLHRQKTYVRKIREIIGALALDLSMSKNAQLTWYLNVVEFGPEVYGIRSAADFYFKKAPQKLSLSECSSLAALLRNPVRASAWLKSGKIPIYFAQRRSRIASHVMDWGILKDLEVVWR